MRREIFENFRKSLKGINGVQSTGYIELLSGECMFVVNIYKKHFKELDRVIPNIYENILVEKRIIESTSFLGKVTSFFKLV